VVAEGTDVQSHGARLLFAFILAGAAFTAAIGADELQSLVPENLAPGVAQPIPADAMASPNVADVEISSPIWAGTALLTQFKDIVPHTRGPRDVSLFRDAAPSVVLIQTKDGIGSGSMLKDNVILTSLHVVGTERQVTVVFKPSDPSGRLKDDEVSRADVIKADRQRDLALLRPHSLPSGSIRPLDILRPQSPPPGSIRPLDISPQDTIEVGSDVFAIGHPTGEAWTYTKGIVSAFRPDYVWSAGLGTDQHRATVIQTQTPINPGNSGGPLLSEDGKIVGVNSFITQEAQGLNFAVAAKELRFFMANADSGLEAQNSCAEPKTIFEGRNSKNTGFLRSVSVHCDDKADLIIFVADNKREPVVAYLDLNRRGKTEGIVFDQGRTGKWSLSYWDFKLDDTFPVKGVHPDGKLLPNKYESRCPPGSIPLSKLRCSQI
jgi:S1-C subfamily serine protease